MHETAVAKNEAKASKGPPPPGGATETKIERLKRERLERQAKAKAAKGGEVEKDV